MINRRIAISGISILAALALAGGAAFAVFTDQASSVGNTFTSGNANLSIAPHTVSGPGTFASSIPGATFNNIAPGFQDRFLFWLKNESASTINLDILADVSAVGGGAGELRDTMLVSWTCDTDGNGGLADNTPSPAFSPDDWFNGGNTGLGILTPGEQMICSMNFDVPSSATNTIADETVVFDTVYDATQTP